MFGTHSGALACACNELRDRVNTMLVMYNRWREVI